MKTFHTRKDKGTGAGHRRGAIIGFSGFIVVAATCAFPLPGLMKEIQLGRQVKDLKEQRCTLKQMEQEVVDLERELPRVMRNLMTEINSSLPRVGSLLTLRNLLLAQAEATDVKVESCTFSNPVSLKYEVPEGDLLASLASMEMELRGSAAPVSLYFFVGLLESTELVYMVNGLSIIPSSTREGKITFRLDLKVHFRTEAKEILLETSEEEGIR